MSLSEQAAIAMIQDQLRALVSTLRNSEYLTEVEAQEETRLSREILCQKRKDGVLMLGVHWTRVGKRVLYNREMLLHWVQFSGSDPKLHAAKIQDFILRNKPVKSRRSR